MRITNDRLHRVSVPRRPPLHLPEILLILLTIIWFLVATWSIGGVHAPTQLVLLGLSGIALLIALALPYDEAFSTAIRLERLIRFPIFWLGILLFGYMAVQYSNPYAMIVTFQGEYGDTRIDLRGISEESLEEMTEEELEALPRFPRFSWLPVSMHAPFIEVDLAGEGTIPSRNPLRVMILWGSVWLLVCALWVGLTRRRSLHSILFFLVVINGIAFTGVALIQIFDRTDKILWFYQSPVHSFVGTFIYRGHGAAYMNCLIVLALGMFFHYGKVRKSAESSGFTLIYMIAALLLTYGVFASGSRMGMICCTILWVLFVLAFVADWIHHRWSSPAKVGTCALMALNVGVILFAIGTEKVDSSLNRFRHIDSHGSVTERMEQNRSTLQMIGDRPMTGWGAGSYRWAFIPYADANENLQPRPWQRSGRLYPHAHNDILQPLAELGILGILPLLGMLGFWIWQITLSFRYLDNGLLFMTAGSTVLLLHASTDPLFHSAAVLGLWSLGFLTPVFAARLMRTRAIPLTMDP